MANVPVGFRFHPTDEELIRHYLHLKNKLVKGAAEEEAAAVVPEYDLYGETEPWKIWEEHGGADLYDQDLFFFTKLKKVNPHGTRINRKIGAGTWSEGEPSRPVFVGGKKNKTAIGRKRKFRYENKSSDHHGCWYMEEYSLDGIKSADYVICRLRENNRSGGAAGGNRDSLAISVAASMESSGPIPVGFRFHPTDQELICYFLYNKNKGKGGRGLAMLMAAEDRIMGLPAPAEEKIMALPAAEEEKIMALPAAEVPLAMVTVEEDKKNTNDKEGQAPTPPEDEKKNNSQGEAEAAAAAVPVAVEEEEKKKEEEEEKKRKEEEEEKKKKEKGKAKKMEGEMQAAPLLLLEYMKPKEDDEQLPPKEAEETVDVGKRENNMFLHEFDLFGSTEPWEIWDMFKGAELRNQDLFFFTQLKKVNPKGSRIGRKVGTGGTWSEGDVSKPIVDDRTGNPIGRKRKLRYEKIGSPHHACWYLDEYSLLDADIGDYVICRLRKNDKLAAAAFAAGESVNRKRKAVPSTTTATAQEPKQPPATAEEPKQAPATAEESQAPATAEVSQAPATADESQAPATTEESKQPLATAEESNDAPATAEESKQEDSSNAKRRRITGLTQVEEAAADVLMNMANSTLNHNTLKLFGIEIGSTPTIGGE